MKALGVLCRFKELNDPQALVLFFRSCISPIMFYASPAWAGAATTHTSMLDSVFKFFCSIVRHRVESMKRMFDSDILRSFGILMTSQQLVFNDLCFLHAVCSGRMHLPEFMSRVCFYAPVKRVRRRSLFYLPTARLTKFWRLPAIYN